MNSTLLVPLETLLIFTYYQLTSDQKALIAFLS